MNAELFSAGLPYNSIEVLILGNITNNGTTPISLKNSWIIVPFSMGVQTEYEGIWKRIGDPNHYFKIFCWCASLPEKHPSINWSSSWHVCLWMQPYRYCRWLRDHEHSVLS